MTSDSRIEAVARAIDQSGCWETYDDLMRAGGYFPSDSLLDRLEKSKQRAQAAIAANDAWLKEQDTREVYPGAWQCSICGHRAEGPEDKPVCQCGSLHFHREHIS